MIPNDEQCRICSQAVRDKPLLILEEWLNSDDHLSLFKWEVREKIRELRQGGE